METKAGNLLKRIVVILIVFSMMLLNGLPILSNISLAAGNPEANIEVNGYFSTEEIENTNSLVCDVNNQTIKLNFDISVKGEGYLKNGAIRFGNNLNFVLNPDGKTFIKDNQLKLPEVNTTANLNISIPISFENKEKFTFEDLSQSNIVTFKGEYVDNEGIIHVINRELKFDLTWQEQTDSNISCEVIKNLEFEKDGVKGRILQTKVKIAGNIQNKLPIKSTEVAVEIPQLQGLEFADVTIDVDKLLYTQGREDFNTDFTSANYRVEDGKVIINVQNNVIDEKIISSNGEDIYILTFIYNGEVANNEDIISKISANIVSYSENIENKEVEVTYNLSETVGEAVQYMRENKETPISRGYLMADSNQEKYEIEYIKKDILSVSRAELVSGLQIDDVDEYFVNMDETENYDVGNSAYYKKTEFSKDNLVQILGENGNVQILNMNDEVIGEVTFDMETDENNSFVIEYGVPISAIKIKFSDPIADGNISVVNTKSIKSINYSRDEIKTFNRLVSHAQGYAIYNEGITTELGIVESTINISNTTSGTIIEVENPEFSTVNVNESVNFKLRLNNNEDISDLYQNPIFEIRLPEVIKEINIRNIDMFYANGELEISSVETFVDGQNQVIRISLTGTQSSYGINKETNGTVISFDVDLFLDELAVDGSANVELYYYNESATNYDNGMPWLMVTENDTEQELLNGFSKFEITYKAPVGLMNVQTTEMQETTNIEENVEEVSEEENEEQTQEQEKEDTNIIPTKQNASSELLAPGEPAKLATMFITVMNNTNKKFNNFKILGRIPFIGNTDVITGEDLGTTIDTILDSEFRGMTGVNYTVYYSENPNATNNLYDSNNKWKTDFYKAGGVKSYLIVFDDDYILEPNTKLEFEYDYVIPANLEEGDAFYGTYATYFTETVTQIDSKDSVDKAGYETDGEAEIEASIRCLNERIVELEEANFEISLKNISDKDAKNVQIELTAPEYFILMNVIGEDVSYTYEDEKLYINMYKLRANSEEILNVNFDISRLNMEEDITINGLVTADNVNSSVEIDTGNLTGEQKLLEVNDFLPQIKMRKGKEQEGSYYISNVSEEELNNIVITKKLDEKACFKRSEIEDKDFKEEYDSNTREITWTIDSLQPGEYIYIKYIFECDKLDADKTSDISKMETNIQIGDNNLLNATNELKFYQAKILVKDLTDKQTGYSTQGEKSEYLYEITNMSEFEIYNLSCYFETTDSQNIEYIEVSNSFGTKSVIGTNFIYASLPIGEKTLVKIATSVEQNAQDFILNKISFSADNAINIQKSSYTLIESSVNTNKELTGVVYIDSNGNKIQEDLEMKLTGVIVDLYNSETNEKVSSTITDVSGRYMFKNITDGNYYVKFNYNDTEYLISTGNSTEIAQNNANVMCLNDKCVTDVISIAGKSIGNVDLGLIDENIFDMKVDMTVENMTVQNEAENAIFSSEGSKLSKIDIDPKLVNGSKVLIEYKIIVTNKGGIAGNVTNLVDYLDDEMQFDSSLNPDWYEEADGNIHTRVLKNDLINPGDSRELKLILIKNMTDTNTGLVHNSVEIAEATNEKGIKDIDSTPGNRLDEDDLSYADSIIGVKTGLELNIMPISITALILLIPIAFLVWRIIEKRRYV